MMCCTFVESSPFHTLAAVDMEDSPIRPGIPNQFHGQIFITIFCYKETSQRMIHANVVPRNKFLDKFVVVQCVHGDEVSYPLAKVEVVVDGKSYLVEAAVVKKLPKSVLLGRDVPELLRIGTPEEALAATTRAQAKRKKEEDESAVKRVKLVMAIAPSPPSPIKGSTHPPLATRRILSAIEE